MNVIKRFIVYHVIVVNLVHEPVKIYLIRKMNIINHFLVGRGISNSYLSNLETPPNSPHSNLDEIDSNSGSTNIDDSGFDQKTSDDDSRFSNSQSTSISYHSAVTARQTIATANRPTSASVTNGTAFKMMSISGNICPRCSKTVYSAEEVKAAGKVK